MDAAASTTPTAASASAAQQPVASASDTAAAATEGTSNALSSDFETFLKLLTAQMKNQDPQEPLDSTQFVSQLASFSAVEQQISTNQKLDDLIGAMNANAAGQMSSWIGATVQSPAAAEFSGEPIEVHYKVPADATYGRVIVTSEGGKEIATLPVEVGSTSIIWDGKGSDKVTAANGNYTFEIEGFDATKSVGKAPAETFSTVSEVRLLDGSLKLVFPDGTQLDSNEVVALR